MIFLAWLFSKKHYELKIVFATLGVLFIVPVIAVVVVVASPIAAIGNALASVNPITHLVDIFDPNGNKLSEVQLSTVWPAKGYVSDEFGTYDLLRKELHLGPHTGIDIANEHGRIGDPITPFMEGRVIRVNDIDNGNCGKYVKVQHAYNITSLYCHMSEPLATPNQEVKPGDIIGLEGETGAATGPHVHFQVMVYDIPVNPRIFMVGEPERNQ